MPPPTLFIRLRLLGDIILTIPAVELFKAKFPDEHLTYVVENEFLQAAELIPGADSVITVPRTMRLKDFLHFRREVKSRAFQRAIDFHSGPKSALLTKISSIPIRIGYRTPNRNWAFNRMIPRPSTRAMSHSVINQALLLKHVGIDVDDPQTVVPPYPPVHPNPRRLSAEVTSMQIPGSAVIVHIGAGNRFRDWGLDRFSGLLERLNQHGIEPVLIGNTAQEIERGQKLDHSFRVSNLAGRLNLHETLHLISRAKVYAGVDSGPLHLASLTKTALVGLYGPNLPEISGPWRKQDVTILQHSMRCRPCSQRRCKYDTILCLRKIQVQDVYEAIRSHLA